MIGPTQHIRWEVAQSAGQDRRRRRASIELSPLFRAKLGRIDESMQTADIHRQLSIMAIAYANVRQNFVRARGDIRESPLTPSCHRIPTHARAAIAKGYAHRPGANSEASWDPAAGKKHSRNPRLSDQHQAISRRPQESMRSLQVSSRLAAPTHACMQTSPPLLLQH